MDELVWRRLAAIAGQQAGPTSSKTGVLKDMVMCASLAVKRPVAKLHSRSPLGVFGNCILDVAPPLTARTYLNVTRYLRVVFKGGEKLVSLSVALLHRFHSALPTQRYCCSERKGYRSRATSNG